MVMKKKAKIFSVVALLLLVYFLYFFVSKNVSQAAINENHENTRDPIKRDSNNKLIDSNNLIDRNKSLIGSSNDVTDKITIRRMLPQNYITMKRFLHTDVFSQLCEEDKQRIRRWRKQQVPYSNNVEDYFKLVMDTYKTVCAIKSRIGGKWIGSCPNKAYDGHKFICMEDLSEDISNGKCLVYSFGVKDDLTFEEQLGKMGCKVYAHDPTVTYPKDVRKNVEFYQIGVCAEERLLSGKPCKTLLNIIKSNGHLERKITFLKVDIEKEELRAIPQWLRSGALAHVQQFGVEIHQKTTEISYMMKLMRDVQLEGNFRAINWERNPCHARNHLFEIVFKKIDPTFTCAAYVED